MNESEEQAATRSNSFGSSEIQEERVKLEVLGWQNPLGGRAQTCVSGKTQCICVYPEKLAAKQNFKKKVIVGAKFFEILTNLSI